MNNQEIQEIQQKIIQILAGKNALTSFAILQNINVAIVHQPDIAHKDRQELCITTLNLYKKLLKKLYRETP